VLGASLDVGNRGVLALASSVAKLTEAASPGARITFHYSHHLGGSRRLQLGGRETEVQVRNCRLSPRSAPAQHLLIILLYAALYRCGVRGPARRNPWLRSLLDADFIGDIAGGDSFSDIYGLRRFVSVTLPLLSVALLGRPFTMLPQTYGPFRNPISRGLARAILRRAQVILTRDHNCGPLVRDICGRTPQFCPDVAFVLDARPPDARHAVPPCLRMQSRPTIGLNVSGLLYMGGYTGGNMFGLRSNYRELMDQLVDSVLSNTTAQLLLVPHVFGAEEREIEASEQIARLAGARHPGRVFLLEAALSEQELKWLIGQTDCFVGSRMHACIAALSQCVPAVGLAYSDKFLGVFQSAGVGDAVIDLRTVEATQIVARTLETIDRRAHLRSALQERVPHIQQRVLSTFQALLAT
jgi:colanic acid/amylovoran biosynthesis protein